MKKQAAKYICVYCTVVLIFALFSCSKTDKSILFQQKLNEADVLMQEGELNKALSYLGSLRKKALFPIQYLSIAKRELKLSSPVQALQTLKLGLKKYPNDSQLLTVIAFILTNENRLDDAAGYALQLGNSPYEGIGAEILIRADRNAQTYRTPVSFWKTGFRLTGEHVFLENAGLLLAYEGKIKEAALLRPLIAQSETLHSPYFWSCLAYDAGYFKPVLDDLAYSLAYVDMIGLPENNPKAFEYARRHILLAADSSAGLKDLEQARAFWQEYADRYPDASGDIFYNLAMTAPSKKEKLDALINCVTNEPGYYPAVAQYVRTWRKMNNESMQKNTLTEYLSNKGFFSLDMEKALYLSSTFTLSAEDVLNNALQLKTNDPRFLLEAFRYKYIEPETYTRGSGEMWKILEKHPHTPLVKSYARWYFCRFGDFNAGFTVEKTDDIYEDMFYDGIRYAVQGHSSKALEAFQKAEKDDRYVCYAIINQGYIYNARQENDMAIKSFLRASDLLDENGVLKSKMLYEAARLFAEHNGEIEAIKLLDQALQIDANNHRAAVLRQTLRNM